MVTCAVNLTCSTLIYTLICRAQFGWNREVAGLKPVLPGPNLKLVPPVSNQGRSATYNLHNRKMRRKWTAPPTSREEWTRYTKLWPGSICCQVQLNIRGSNVIGEDDWNGTRLSSAYCQVIPILTEGVLLSSQCFILFHVSLLFLPYPLLFPSSFPSRLYVS